MKRDNSPHLDSIPFTPFMKVREIRISSEDLDYWPIEPLSLCEEGTSLTIPTKGRYIRISSMTSIEDGTETVLNDGNRQITLNGRCLKVFYPTPDEE